MSQLTNITLGTTVYYPVRVDSNGVASLRTRGDSVSDASSISIQVRPSRASGATKVMAKIARPYWYTAKGDTNKKGREVARADFGVVIPPNASAADRAEIYKQIKAFVETSQFKEAIENLESLF